MGSLRLEPSDDFVDVLLLFFLLVFILVCFNKNGRARSFLHMMNWAWPSLFFPSQLAPSATLLRSSVSIPLCPSLAFFFSSCHSCHLARAHCSQTRTWTSQADAWSQSWNLEHSWPLQFVQLFLGSQGHRNCSRFPCGRPSMSVCFHCRLAES